MISGMPTPPRKSALCVAACVLGFLGLLTCGLASLPAIICGYMGRASVQRSRGALAGENLARTGVHLGWAGILLGILVLFFGGSERGWPQNAERNRTVSAHATIRVALEKYRETFGEYPSAGKSGMHIKSDGMDFDASSAHMLYQAITGDGTDMIKIASTTSKPMPSDGQITEEEKKNLIGASEVPKSMVLKTAAGYMLIDGWGHPFQYTIGGAESVNATYDLWSFGKSRPPFRTDKPAKQDENSTAAWIKNW
jgi:hypothetical protein